VVTENILTIPEISARLKIDRHTVTRLFQDERGVLIFGNDETQKHRRKYRSIRVPESVVNRVLARLAVRA
jgi:hypothetical protein